jgi:M6 family metalloprotease-like protein/uncharacterized repeat protein (TIGR02543 family)
MRLRAKSLLRVLLLSVFTFSLSACGEFSFPADITTEATITDVSFDQSLLEYSYEISDFNIEDYFLTVTFSDGSTSQVEITEFMISSSELPKLSVAGTQTIEVLYRGFKVAITINLRDSNNELNLLLMSIYNTGISEGTVIDMTYEEWLESIRGEQGYPGTDGKEVTFQVDEGYIQWQYVGEETWTNLVPLSTLTGSDGTNGIDGVDGKEVTFQVDEGYIQWQYVGEETWTNLVELATLNGTSGESAYDIYIKYHSDYQGTEEQWIDDLVNGRLGDQHKVTFESNGGSSISSQSVFNGDKVTKPNDPVKEGYDFLGWYYQDELWIFIGYPVTSDIVLEAKYEAINYTLTYNLDGGSFKEELINFTYTIESDTFWIPEPSKEGYVFIGWTYFGQETPIRNATISQGSQGSYDFQANWWRLDEGVIVNGGLPTVGNPQVIVILVRWLNGTNANIHYDELQSRFFSNSSDTFTSTSTGLDSVRSFLYRSSYGKVDLMGNVYEYSTLKENDSYINLNEIANEVIDYYEDTISWENYDSNSDGFVDGFYIVFESPPSYGGPNFVSVFDRNVGTKNITQICSISSPDVGTMVHETIHMFGPPDIYASVGVNPGGSMASSVMDQGYGDIPGIMKYVLGWIDHPIFVSSHELQTIKLDSLSRNGNIVIVYPNADSSNKNWFIIEYITPEMNNLNYFGLQSSGGIRIWRTNMYLDDDGNIIGIEWADHGFLPSPYEYLEAVNNGEYNYFFYTGDEFTPYSYLSSYYGASLVWNGNSKELRDISFSGIYIDNIIIDGTEASFDIRIEDSPQAFDVVVNDKINTGGDEGNFINDSNFILGELNFNIEVKVPENTVFTFTNEFDEEIFVNLVVDKSYRNVLLVVDRENADKITLNQAYIIRIPDGIFQTYFGTAIIFPAYSVSFTNIQNSLIASEEISFQYNSIYHYDMPKLLETGENQVSYFSFNEINDSLTNLVNLNVLDTTTYEVTTYALENQLDSIIQPSNNYIVSYDVFMMENGNFVTRITLNLYETYYDYYNSSGDLIGSFINDRTGNGGEEVLYLEGNTIYLKTNVLVQDSRIAKIVFGDSIEILSSGIDIAFSNLFVNEWYKMIKTSNDGYVAIGPNSSWQYVAYYFNRNGETTLLENTFDFFSGQEYYSVYNNITDLGFFFSVTSDKIAAYWFNIETETLEEIVILSNVAIKPHITSSVNVEYKNGTYLLYFNSVAANNMINYQTTYIIILDDNLNVKGYYRHGNSTYRFVTIPTIMSNNRIISSTTYNHNNFLFYYLDLESS